jgi:hypothetical protein
MLVVGMLSDLKRDGNRISAWYSGADYVSHELDSLTFSQLLRSPITAITQTIRFSTRSNNCEGRSPNAFDRINNALRDGLFSPRSN